jgi:Ca-activated chloride channel family protein
MKYVLTLFLCLTSLFIGSAQSIDIPQVDTAKVLTNQTVRLYLSTEDVNGTNPLVEERIGNSWQPMEILSTSQKSIAAKNTFIFLIDNSGSMYFDDFGNRTQDEESWRITKVKNAITDFLKQNSRRNDQIEIATFNTFYTLLAAGQMSDPQLLDSLNTIQRPGEDEAFTELYYALLQALEASDNYTGRIAIVVLSDGQNFPYSLLKDDGHPVFGARDYLPSDVLTSLVEKGISIHALVFGNDVDQNLSEFIEEGGGELYTQLDGDSLLSVYEEIRESVENEIIIEYRTLGSEFSQRRVRVTLGGEQVEREFTVNSLFGYRETVSPMVLILSIFILLVAAFLIYLMTNQKLLDSARLQVLRYAHGGKTNRTVIDITEHETTIGTAPDADMSIIQPTVEETIDATILFDEQRNEYRIEGDASVNNNPSQKGRKIEDGDIITVAGTQFVFQDPEKDPMTIKSKKKYRT